MKRQDLLTILITFAMGIVLGFYIYVTGFATNNQRESVSPDEAESGLIITGEAYGGCQRVGNCPSFNIAVDGTYRYFYTPLGAVNK